MKYATGVRDEPDVDEGGTKVAASEAILRSHAHATDRPAPAAAPFTAAITGFSRRLMATRSGGNCPRPVADIPWRLAKLGQVLPDAETAAGSCEHDCPEGRARRPL